MWSCGSDPHKHSIGGSAVAQSGSSPASERYSKKPNGLARQRQVCQPPQLAAVDLQSASGAAGLHAGYKFGNSSIIPIYCWRREEVRLAHRLRAPDHANHFIGLDP